MDVTPRPAPILNSHLGIVQHIVGYKNGIALIRKFLQAVYIANITIIFQAQTSIFKECIIAFDIGLKSGCRFIVVAF